MTPISITFKGIGPYREQAEVHFAHLYSPVAVVAGYGSGKSFLLEAVMLALYAKGAWYQGSIYDMMTQDGDGDAQIVLDFAHNGEVYRLVRTVHTGHSAMIYRGRDEVAGPKVGDVARWVDAHIGTWETSASTWYLSQSRANDLCGQPGEANLVARRRDVFNELLGVEGLDEVAERMRQERTITFARIKDLEAQLAGEGSADAAVSLCEAELLAERERLAHAITAEKAASENVKFHRAALKERSAKLRQTETLLETAEQLTEDERRSEDLRRTIVIQGDAPRLVKELETAEAQLASLVPTVDARERWEKARDALQRHQDRMEAERREIEALQAGMPTEETVELAVHVNYIAAEYEEAEAGNATAGARNDTIREEAHRLRARSDALIFARERLTQTLANRPVTPFGNACAPCPLMVGWTNLPRRLEAIATEVSQVVTDTAALPCPLPIQDTATLRQRLAQAQEAVAAVQRAAKTEARIRALENRAQPEAPVPGPEPDDRRKEVQAARETIQGLSRARAKLEALRGAVSDLDRCTQTCKVLRDKLGAFTKGDVAGAKAEETLAQANLIVVEQLEEKARDAARNAHANSGRAEALLEAALQAAALQAERRELVRTLTARSAALDDLVVCFGPRGVRQILIDSAAPELEEIADGLFETATQGRMRLRISTQRLLKDGSTAEDFAVMIKDSAGERDVTAHSGGEIQLCAILFRIAVSMWIGRLRGQQPGCLFLDEAFDRLGADGAEDLMRAINGMADHCGMICVVTHDPLIADRMRSQIHVTRGAGGARIICA